MKDFNTFFIEADEAQSMEPQRVADDAVTVFGRHQPPHLGHKLTFDRANDLASNIGDNTQADQVFYSSRSTVICLWGRLFVNGHSKELRE